MCGSSLVVSSITISPVWAAVVLADPNGGGVGSRRVLLWASFMSCGGFSNGTARTNLCRCGTSVTLTQEHLYTSVPVHLKHDIEDQCPPSLPWPTLPLQWPGLD